MKRRAEISGRVLFHLSARTAITVGSRPAQTRPTALSPFDSQQTLLLRDYSANIREQLKFLAELAQKQSMNEFRSFKSGAQ
jgi:hypothetical protein